MYLYILIPLAVLITGCLFLVWFRINRRRKKAGFWQKEMAGNRSEMSKLQNENGYREAEYAIIKEISRNKVNS
jgi:hypothetical protein